MQKTMVSTLAVLMLGAGAQAAPAQHKDAGSTGADTTQQVQQSSRPDPNMPSMYSPPNAPLEWSYNVDPEVPLIFLRGALASPARAAGDYLGFNDEGSLIVHPDNKKVYVWNLKSFRLAERYETYKDVPKDVFASLRNPTGSIKEMQARNKPAKPAAPVAAGNNPSPVNNGAGIFGSDARKTLESALPPNTVGAPAAEGAGFHGTGAAISGGVLAFTMVSGKKVTYKVVRPGVMANNPQVASADLSGTWLSFGDGDKAMIFSVGSDNTVTGKEMPSALVKMLMQGVAHQ
jgi:hypothetical protein